MKSQTVIAVCAIFTVIFTVFFGTLAIVIPLLTK